MTKPVSKLSFIFYYHMRIEGIITSAKVVKEINLVNKSQL